MQTIAETCVRFDAAHLSINLVSEIAVRMFPTLNLFSQLIISEGSILNEQRPINLIVQSSDFLSI